MATPTKASADEKASRTRTSVVDQTYNAIITNIRQGRLKAGERLTESRLTSELGVSRSSLREAMHRLSAERIIDFFPNRGAVVRGLSRQDMADFFQIRKLIESFAAERAAERINEPHARDRVLSMIEDAEKLMAAPSCEAFARHDAEFHSLVLELCGNQLLFQEWRRMRQSRFRDNYLSNIPQDQIVAATAEHQAVLRALNDGDPDLAGKAAAAHVEMTNRRIQRLPRAEFDRLFNALGG